MVKVKNGNRDSNNTDSLLAIAQEHLDCEEFKIVDARPFMEGFEVNPISRSLDMGEAKRFLIVYPLERKLETYSVSAEDTALMLATLYEQRHSGEFTINRMY